MELNANFEDLRNLSSKSVFMNNMKELHIMRNNYKAFGTKKIRKNKKPSPEKPVIEGKNKLSLMKLIKEVKHTRHTIPKSLKKCVWDKYIGADKGTAKCVCCNHQDIRQIDFHCGHVLAVKNGGLNSIDNLRPICSQCNLSMRTQNMDEFMKNFQKN
jgi:5-methylcytosine-specific restriction endonuclease McrA